MKNATFSFGEWRVMKARNAIQHGELRHQLEPKVMNVLVALCTEAGAVVSAEELLARCWGSTLPGDNQVHKTITQLRKLLGDSAASPIYIETIRKRGYRAIAAVTFDEQVDPWLAESPFRGLEAFDARHAAVFFGREDDCQRLFDALRAQAASGHCLVMLLGPSGCGKTSLVQAGLIPMLERSGGALACACFTSLDLGLPAPGRLFVELGGAMLDWQLGDDPAFPGESAESLGTLLATEPLHLSSHLSSRLSARRAAASDAQAGRLVLFLDRFEALFALPSMTDTERAALVHAIDVLAGNPNMMILIACRNDFYPRIADYPPLMQGKAHGAHVDIGRPDSAQLARIIRLPAQAARLRFGVDRQSGARLDDVLCQSVSGSPDALPLLQYTLQELYRQRHADGELSFEVFARLGGVDGAIGRRAEEVIAVLDPAQRAALPRVLALIVTVSPASDSVTSCSARWTELDDDQQRQLVGALVEARLLVSELVGSVAGFRVAHEALLRRWTRASEWIASHRSSLLIRARTAALARRWIAAGRPADLLLPPGQQLDEVRAVLGRGDVALAAPELALVQASQRRAQLRSRIRMTALGVILLLATLAATLGLMARSARSAAEQRRIDAASLIQFMLGELAEKMRPLGRLDLLDGVSAKALTYLARENADESGPSGVVQRAKALHVIGEVRLQRGDLQAAHGAFAAARAPLEAAVTAHPDDPDLLKAIGINAYWIGFIALEKGALAEARRYFLLYGAYAERMHERAPTDVEIWIEQSYAHNNLGSLAVRAGDIAAAGQAFTLSAELKTRALAQRPNDVTLAADLADSLSWLGETRLLEGNLSAALALYERELAIVAKLHAAQPADTTLAEQRADALQHRALLFMALGNDQAAQRDYGVAEQLIARNLVLEPDNSEWQRTLIYIELEQLRLHAHAKLTDADLAALAQLERRVATLVLRDPANNAWARQSARVRTRYALAMVERSRFNAAENLLARASATLEAQLLRDRNDQDSTIALALNYLVQARLRAARGEREGERASCTAARDQLQALAARTNSFKVLDPWVRAQSCLGQSGIAIAAMRRLTAMGYRDTAYMQFLLRQQ